MTLSVPILLTVLGYYVINAAVGAMPKPRPEQVSGFYGWLFGFLQTLCANADRLAEARFSAVIHATQSPQPIPFYQPPPGPKD